MSNQPALRSLQRSFVCLASVCLVTLLLCHQAYAAELQFTSTLSESNRLVGVDARMQLIVTAIDNDLQKRDVTREVAFKAAPSGIVDIDPQGFVSPVADGNVEILATMPDGSQTVTQVSVEAMQSAEPVSFCGQIVPIFTKLGCNGGGCHGKIAGQNGFRLSLLGFEPREDHRHLVAESRGRRVSPAAPDRSLLLLKTTGEMPHGGGARTDRHSHEYRVMRRWISQGMPYDSGEIPSVTKLEVFPKNRRMYAGQSQQLAVIATFDDGRCEDVTRAAVFESNDTQMADVNATGLVSTGEAIGDVAVMARYNGWVSVFRAEIPRQGAVAPSELAKYEHPIDQAVRRKLASLGIEPSPSCDDSSFLRRVTIDICGRIPTLDETQQFLADESADKRAKCVDRLLDSEDYASHFARKWSVILRNRRDGGALKPDTMVFHHWIKDSLQLNKPYDTFVRELLTARGSAFSNPAVVWLNHVTDQNERVEDVSQLFMGQRIQCARCHHHPYEKWSQEDYARMSAFFTTVSKKDVGGEITFVSRVAPATAPHPRTNQPLPPAGLDAIPREIDPYDDPRGELASWLTSPDNPFFARSLVNRYWKHFMGRGLVEPEDDMRVTNPPSNPELMDALAQSFTESGFDLRELIRTICTSETYASSSDANETNLIDRRSYSRFFPKRLLAETLLDAVDRVTGATTDFGGMPAMTKAIELPDTGFDSYFLTVFGQPDAKTACECERSAEANLAQSLHLLNSEEMQNKLATQKGRAHEYAENASRTVEEKVRELYLVSLSREPSEKELKASLTYLSHEVEPVQLWEDLIWALVNSKEFLFNH
ncbi:DUF1549 domain-containing protein [Rhodopirellula sp. MGV]|uniref:DUF1549 domain-containing protein n=1 Tax=Rhodopirellula sp. MGV TaxID=2023130 RepID=UPI000B95DA6A|nr:DUF1549 domain-containing protein [Rhodopirellula sp. MGV]OYP35504.1 hypothetical protein CGZ80_11735 [Rhodopirellula sp. MGV]PNY33946.1 DUF1553 domain-containing protein [Rhodopirellula baltica]